MKKLLVLALVAGVVSVVQAGNEGESKEEYVQKRMEWAQKDPKWNPTRAFFEAKFDRLDTDGNGKVTAAEIEAGKKS